MTFSLLLVYLFHSVGVPWPFKMMPLPHSDSTPSLAFGLVTDAERSFDIVPVSQSFVGYRSYLRPFYLLMFALGLFPDPIYGQRIPQFQTVNTNKLLCFMRPMWSLPSLPLQLHLRKWLEITGTSREGRQAGLWPWELWAKEDGAQLERSILI